MFHWKPAEQKCKRVAPAARSDSKQCERAFRAVASLIRSFRSVTALALPDHVRSPTHGDARMTDTGLHIGTSGSIAISFVASLHIKMTPNILAIRIMELRVNITKEENISKQCYNYISSGLILQLIFLFLCKTLMP